MSTDPREFEHPIDGTGGNVTPLVEVIAEALYDDSNTRQMGPPWAEYVKTSSRVEYWRDKARAVLHAISEAGTVEWGWSGPRGYMSGAVSEEEARIVGAQPRRRVVSRITGPWTAVG